MSIVSMEEGFTGAFIEAFFTTVCLSLKKVDS